MTTDKDEKDIKAAVEERLEAEAAAIAAEATEDDPAPPAFVRECFCSYDRGDGTLFAALHRGRFLVNVSAKDEWLRWAGHHWELDMLKTRYTGVEAVVAKYAAEIADLNVRIKDAKEAKSDGTVAALRKTKGDYTSRIRRLRGDGADKCLQWAHRIEDGGLGVRGEQFDQQDWLLACDNGVIELRTGRFRDGRPGDLLTKAVPHEWRGDDCPAPIWRQFLADVFGGNDELASYVQRLIGYAITGVTSEHIVPVLYGEGRNGKGVLVETIKYVLGDYARPIQSEMLLDQKNGRSSSGPSPDIMELKGLRVAFASETDEGKRFSTSRVKWLSGGDMLTGRNPHDRYSTVFEPTHLLCLLTNHLPHASGDDFAFWSRVHLVPFKMRFVDHPEADNERPRDKGLFEKLKAEAPGILAWMVEGCIEWQRQGLNPPAVVTAATEEYRSNEDLIGEFLEACAYKPEDTDPEARITFGECYNAFTTWYLDDIGDKVPRKKRFSAMMEKRFRKDKIGGYVWFYGIEFLPEP